MDVVVELIGKPENALRSESESTSVYQKETKLNKKGRSDVENQIKFKVKVDGQPPS